LCFPDLAGASKSMDGVFSGYLQRDANHSPGHGNESVATSRSDVEGAESFFRGGYYEEFGFLLATWSDDRAVLIAGKGCRLTLRQLANGQPRPR
jgi:hypothetical protein